MRIVPLVENTTKSELKAKHGLSLYIETRLHKILFDLGSDNTLFENAVKRNIDISKVDTVIISHGHFDHGGALKKFLDVNSSANIYVQKEAFEPHYSKTLLLKIPVGIDSKLKSNRQYLLWDVDMLALLISCKKQRSTDHVFVLVVFICSIRLQGNQYQRDC